MPLVVTGMPIFAPFCSQDHVAARNANIKEILRGVKLGIPSMDVMNQFNHIFIVGDLNYRLNYGRVGSLTAWQRSR